MNRIQSLRLFFAPNSPPEVWTSRLQTPLKFKKRNLHKTAAVEASLQTKTLKKLFIIVRKMVSDNNYNKK